MEYLALRIIATIFLTIGTCYFSMAMNPDNVTNFQVSAEDILAVKILKTIFLVGRLFEVAVIWLI